MECLRATSTMETPEIGGPAHWRYKALAAKNEIRLLSIRPPILGRESEAHGKLMHYDLRGLGTRERIEFEGVSYAWQHYNIWLLSELSAQFSLAKATSSSPPTRQVHSAPSSHILCDHCHFVVDPKTQFFYSRAVPR
jgi:hypothetical protein